MIHASSVPTRTFGSAKVQMFDFSGPTRELAGVKFPQALKDADQYGTEQGQELARVNALRRPS